MKREWVESSMMRAVGYDAKKLILEIQFQSGSIYEYFDVPREVYEGLMNASSLGRYFDDEIKDCYQFARTK